MIKAVCFDAFGTICYYSSGRIIMLDETAQVFNALREKGYKIGVISNISRIFAGFLQRALPFSVDCFSAPYLSGAPKPDIRAFSYAADELGFASNEILMIGDSYNNDFMGAKNAGMNALFLDTTNADRTIESISNLTEVINHDYLV